MRWVWGEDEPVPPVAETLGAACQTRKDSPVGVGVVILAARVRARRLDLHWPPCPGPLGSLLPTPLLQGRGVCPQALAPTLPLASSGPHSSHSQGAPFSFPFWSLCRVGAEPDPCSLSSVRAWPALACLDHRWK